MLRALGFAHSGLAAETWDRVHGQRRCDDRLSAAGAARRPAERRDADRRDRRRRACVLDQRICRDGTLLAADSTCVARLYRPDGRIRAGFRPALRAASGRALADRSGA